MGVRFEGRVYQLAGKRLDLAALTLAPGLLRAASGTTTWATTLLGLRSTRLRNGWAALLARLRCSTWTTRLATATTSTAAPATTTATTAGLIPFRALALGLAFRTRAVVVTTIVRTGAL